MFTKEQVEQATSIGKEVCFFLETGKNVSGVLTLLTDEIAKLTLMSHKTEEFSITTIVLNQVDAITEIVKTPVRRQLPKNILSSDKKRIIKK